MWNEMLLRVCVWVRRVWKGTRTWHRKEQRWNDCAFAIAHPNHAQPHARRSSPARCLTCTASAAAQAADPFPPPTGTVNTRTASPSARNARGARPSASASRLRSHARRCSSARFAWRHASSQSAASLARTASDRAYTTLRACEGAG